jgi:hypothetical protein
MSGYSDLEVSPDGTWLTFGGLVFYGENGYYTSEFTEGGWYYAWHLYVSSPTQMNADVALAPLGVPCSGTLPVSVTYVG